MNGDLRVAYRTSPAGERDIVLVPNWFTNCEVFPELPGVRHWIEAITTLGRLIIFDQPGSGASDPVEPGALPTLEQWADSVTAVLDALEVSQAVLVTYAGAYSTAALFAATHPARTTALVLLESAIDGADRTDPMDVWGTGEVEHVLNPDMQFFRLSVYRPWSCITPTIPSSLRRRAKKSPTTYRTRNTLNCPDGTCITSSNRGGILFRRSPSS